ncbi:hypothetical protein BD310DRAFT_925090 [Dichomitus squalens]|uniref:Uncharacterized protein n=1 Tax=Dichomitus squalens TaxID=114155 RepID=A0A4Q9PXU1_9APHY|nr:hypothetical protein BD310DRAFT_925090 [Dichomitus squalens]
MQALEYTRLLSCCLMRDLLLSSSNAGPASSRTRAIVASCNLSDFGQGTHTDGIGEDRLAPLIRAEHMTGKVRR